MKLPRRFYIYFFSTQLIIIVTVAVSFWLLRNNTTRMKPVESLNQTNPVSLPKNVDVKNENQSAESSYLGTYLLSTSCPRGYGVRDIVCDPAANSIGTLNSFSKNITDVNTYGAYCSFKANSGFKGTIKATCDRDLLDVPVYDARNFSPGINSQIPDIYEIWTKGKTEKIAENEYSTKLSCTSGYTASNVMCDEYLQDLQSPSELLSSGVVTENGESTGSCRYQSQSPTLVTTRLNCRK